MFLAGALNVTKAKQFRTTSVAIDNFVKKNCVRNVPTSLQSDHLKGCKCRSIIVVGSIGRILL